METAQTLINDILQECLVQATEQQIQAIDFQTALRYCNRYMAQLDAQGIRLGWTNLSNPADAVTIPDGAVAGVVFNVAMQLCSSYDIEPNPLLPVNARDSMVAMRQLGVNVSKQNFPSTLPIGSGNEQDGFDNYHFYPDCCEDNNQCGDDC